MRHAVLCSAFILVLAGLASAQMGPQILYPGKFQIVRGVRTPSRYEVAARSKSFGMSSDPRTPVEKAFYVPPNAIGIRELIARNNGLDPVLPTSQYVNVGLNDRLARARANPEPFPRDKFAAPHSRIMPSADEMAGTAGTNSVIPPYGVGIDPIGAEFNAMPDGPMDPSFRSNAQYHIKDQQPAPPARPIAVEGRPLFPKPEGSFIETEADVDAEFEKMGAGSEADSESEESSFLELEAEVASPQYDIKHSGPVSLAFTEGSSAIRMVKQLPDSIRRALEDRERNNPMFPPSPLEEKKLVVAKENRPVMVKKIGSKEAMAMLETNQNQQQGQAQTQAQTQQQEAQAQADASATAAAEAEAALRAKIEAEIREKLAAEQAAAERSKAEAEVLAAKEAEEAALKAVEAEAEDRAQAEAEAVVRGQSLAEVDAKQELDALAEAVAQDTIKSQEKLVSKAMDRLKNKIDAAATKAANEATQPWWNRESGIKQNEANKLGKAADRKTAATPTFTEVKSKRSVWDPPAATMDTPLAQHGMDLNVLSGAVTAKGYGAVPAPQTMSPMSLMETKAGASSPIAPMYHAYPPHSGQAVVKVQRQANPYAFSTMDLLYPKLRRVWGLSGWPTDGGEGPAMNAAAPAVVPDSSGPNYNGNPAAFPLLNQQAGGRNCRGRACSGAPLSANPNSIIINVNGGAAAPASSVTHTTSTAAASTDASFPVGAGAASPYSTYFPGNYAPPASHVIHAGTPTPGSSLPDNGSFGELKV